MNAREVLLTLLIALSASIAGEELTAEAQATDDAGGLDLWVGVGTVRKARDGGPSPVFI